MIRRLLRWSSAWIGVGLISSRRSSTGWAFGMWNGWHWGRRVHGSWKGVREVVQHQELRSRCVLVVDATGVGEPVVDLLRRARLGCEICAVTITGGEHARANGLAAMGGGWSVPKAGSDRGGAGAAGACRFFRSHIRDHFRYERNG